MAAWLIALTGVIYLVVSADLWRNGQYGLAAAYMGYAAANVGLWIVAKGG